MSIKGSAYSRFRRALHTGNLALIKAAAAELPRIGLGDALSICEAMRARPATFDRAAARWIGRLALESGACTTGDIEQALDGFELLRAGAPGGREQLEELCARHGLS